MVLPVRPWGNPHLWMCPPVHLLRNAAFLAVETIWVLAWEKWSQVVAPLPGVPWQTEYTKRMMMIALIRYGKRNVDSP